MILRDQPIFMCTVLLKRKIEGFRLEDKRRIPPIFVIFLIDRCKLRYKPDGFAKQNGRGAERADTLTL